MSDLNLVINRDYRIGQKNSEYSIQYVINNTKSLIDYDILLSIDGVSPHSLGLLVDLIGNGKISCTLLPH